MEHLTNPFAETDPRTSGDRQTIEDFSFHIWRQIFNLSFETKRKR